MHIVIYNPETQQNEKLVVVWSLSEAEIENAHLPHIPVRQMVVKTPSWAWSNPY